MTLRTLINAILLSIPLWAGIIAIVANIDTLIGLVAYLSALEIGGAALLLCVVRLWP